MTLKTEGTPTMRFLSLFAALCLATGLSACAGKDHSETRPYLEEAKMRHNVQWENDPWTPQDWIADRGGQVAVIDRFYADGIITNQFVKNDVPVLEVGRTFMELSALDRRRVLETVDYIFGMTDAPQGMFSVQHAETGDTIGLYTKEGAQFQ
jgi:hypothetical protein